MCNEVSKLIQDHRSIRKYSDESISENILKDILTCGQWAPSSHNVQAYSVVIVRNKRQKKSCLKFADHKFGWKLALSFLFFVPIFIG